MTSERMRVSRKIFSRKFSFGENRAKTGVPTRFRRASTPFFREWPKNSLESRRKRVRIPPFSAERDNRQERFLIIDSTRKEESRGKNDAGIERRVLLYERRSQNAATTAAGREGAENAGQNPGMVRPVSGLFAFLSNGADALRCKAYRISLRKFFDRLP